MRGFQLIGFELLADPDPALPVTEFLRPRVVLELVDTRLTGVEDDPMKKFADRLINDGLVLGPDLPDWDGTDFGPLDARLTCGDVTVIDGETSVPGGSALANVELLRTHLGAHCGGLRKGQVIITGSISGLQYYPAGTAVSGRIEGIGEVSCQLV